MSKSPKNMFISFLFVIINSLSFSSHFFLLTSFPLPYFSNCPRRSGIQGWSPVRSWWSFWSTYSGRTWRTFDAGAANTVVAGRSFWIFLCNYIMQSTNYSKPFIPGSPGSPLGPGAPASPTRPGLPGRPGTPIQMNSSAKFYASFASPGCPGSPGGPGLPGSPCGPRFPGGPAGQITLQRMHYVKIMSEGSAKKNHGKLGSGSNGISNPSRPLKTIVVVQNCHSFCCLKNLVFLAVRAVHPHHLPR